MDRVDRVRRAGWGGGGVRDGSNVYGQQRGGGGREGRVERVRTAGAGGRTAELGGRGGRVERVRTAGGGRRTCRKSGGRGGGERGGRDVLNVYTERQTRTDFPRMALRATNPC